MTWKELTETQLKHSKKILTGSKALIVNSTNGGFYLLIQLADEQKKNRSKIENDQKLVNEIVDKSLPWLKTEFKKTRLKGILFVEDIEKENEIAKIANNLGAKIILIKEGKRSK